MIFSLFNYHVIKCAVLYSELNFHTKKGLSPKKKNFQIFEIDFLKRKSTKYINHKNRKEGLYLFFP